MNSFNLRASDLDLALTLGSGQVFHWRCPDRVQWEGCLGMHFFRLARRAPSTLSVHTTAEPAMARSLLRDYFGLNHSLRSIVKTFPSDPLMQASLQANVGLRLLAQDAWVGFGLFHPLLHQANRSDSTNGASNQPGIWRRGHRPIRPVAGSFLPDAWLVGQGWRISSASL
ncbi:MAG: hypothetical protein EBU26_07930 [Verrucomicrobia bacterium]|nr:hypothetical protein [Verrucomicrobiota bacterium]